MIRLASPVEGDVAAQITACFQEIWDELQRSQHATRTRIAPIQAQLRARVDAYLRAGGEPATTGPSPFPRGAAPGQPPALGDILYDRYRSGNSTDASIVEHAHRVKCGYCPYCGLYMAKKPKGRSPDRDHLRPRSLYPEFALLRVNLVIACDDCNTEKDNQDVDANGQWLFVHPYFDSFLDSRLIEAHLTIEPGSVTANFALKNGLDPAVASRVDRHTSTLDLFSRYADSPLREMTQQLETHRAYLRAGQGSVAFVRDVLRSQGNDILGARPNDPAGHLLIALADHVDLEVFFT